MFNWQQYEMILVEPTHGIRENIDNLFDEFPEHLNKNDNQLLLGTTEIYKQQKEILRYVE